MRHEYGHKKSSPVGEPRNDVCRLVTLFGKVFPFWSWCGWGMSLVLRLSILQERTDNADNRAATHQSAIQRMICVNEQGSNAQHGHCGNKSKPLSTTFCAARRPLVFPLSLDAGFFAFMPMALLLFRHSQDSLSCTGCRCFIGSERCCIRKRARRCSSYSQLPDGCTDLRLVLLSLYGR